MTQYAHQSTYEVINEFELIFKNLKKDNLSFSLDDNYELNLNSNKSPSLIWIVDQTLLSQILGHDYSTFNVSSETAIKTILNFLVKIDERLAKGTTIFHAHSNYFKKIFTRTDYTKYLDALKQFQVLSRIPYENGQFYDIENGVACQYLIMNNYITADDYCLVYRRLNRVNMKKIYEKEAVKFVDPRYIDTLSKCHLDYNKVLRDEISNYLNKGDGNIRKLKYRLSVAYSIMRTRRLKFGPNVKRLFNSFGGLSKVSRNSLYTPVGQTFLELDIKNCQPLLLIAYLKEHNLEHDDNYVEDVNNGVIYDRFKYIKEEYAKSYKSSNNEHYRKKIILQFSERDEVKPEFYSAVLFDFKKHHPINKKFKQLYPKTWKTLATINKEKKNNNSLAHNLQNFESDIIHSVIPKHSEYYFTVHDAIYYTDLRDRVQLIEDLNKIFGKLNLYPKYN